MTDIKFSQLLLDWYAVSGRDLPWRVKGGPHPDPYVVLVSEFMLQQTTVKTVIPYFHRFMKRFPTVFSLAEASQEEVYNYWQGLGYYTRARSLHATAKIIVQEFGGKFPKTRAETLKLKGIGAYTASSLLALAFNLPETVIDGNVIRVICRLYHLTEPAETIADVIKKHAEELSDPRNAADYASAIMDLGALICTPKNPQCLLCPWQKFCLSRGQPDIVTIPNRSKPAKKEKTGRVYMIRNKDDKLLIRKRTEKGLLSGLYEFPWTDCETEPLFSGSVNSGLTITHIFTHFKLTLKIFTLTSDSGFENGRFVAPQDMKNYAFSTLMKKVYQKYLSAQK